MERAAHKAREDEDIASAARRRPQVGARERPQFGEFVLRQLGKCSFVASLAVG